MGTYNHMCVLCLDVTFPCREFSRGVSVYSAMFLICMTSLVSVNDKPFPESCNGECFISGWSGSFLDEPARINYIEYLQGVSRFQEKELPSKLPTEIEYTISLLCGRGLQLH
jgi:hypothetical protein